MNVNPNLIAEIDAIGSPYRPSWAGIKIPILYAHVPLTEQQRLAINSHGKETRMVVNALTGEIEVIEGD